MPSPPLPTDLFGPDRLVSDPAARLAYERDAGLDTGLPDGILYPETTPDVAKALVWAHARGVPVVVRGAGTGLAGGAVAEHGGLLVTTTRMRTLRLLDVEGRTAHAEAGVVNLNLDRAARAKGLYYPPDPSSGRSSCIGGNVGTNAGGPHCFKYGVTTNYVTGIEAVLADGGVVRLGGPALDYPEYDLCGLVVGSEGTLAIVTEAYLRLLGDPPGVKTMMVSFDTLETASEAVSAVISAGLVPAALEMMDQQGMRMLEAFAHAGLPVDAGAALIVEVDGYAASLDPQMDEIGTLLRAHGGYDLRVARDEAERQRIWYARKSAAGAIARLAPGFYLTDVTVRRSLLAEVLGRIGAICRQYDLQVLSIFHAGDGNLHPLILCDPRDALWMERVHRAVHEIMALCVSRDGSITGEHGVGIEKRAFMPWMHSGAELQAMLDVKAVFDPHALLNPGKIFPDDLPAAECLDALPPAPGVFAPATATEAAAGLRAFAESGTRVAFGRAPAGDPSPADVWLSTAALTGLAIAQDDLYVTVGAATPLDALQAQLAPHGLQVPLCAPQADVSAGALVSTNGNAPLRMRYGALRDLVLSTTVALADGRVVRAGRPLVKNVAGYDLPKVFVGAHGTLGLLTDVTFKLSPLPRARQTLHLVLAATEEAVGAARLALAEARVASALVLLHEPGEGTAWTLFYTAEGLPEDVRAELALVEAAWRHAGATSAGPAEATGSAVWCAFLASRAPGAVLLRMGLPVRHLPDGLALLQAADEEGEACLVDYANGLVYVRHTPASARALTARLTSLRQAVAALHGYVVVAEGPPDLTGRVDRWGARPAVLDLMRRLKARWDPTGILNPGAFAL